MDMFRFQKRDDSVAAGFQDPAAWHDQNGLLALARFPVNSCVALSVLGIGVSRGSWGAAPGWYVKAFQAAGNSAPEIPFAERFPGAFVSWSGDHDTTRRP